MGLISQGMDSHAQLLLVVVVLACEIRCLHWILWPRAYVLNLDQALSTVIQGQMGRARHVRLSLGVTSRRECQLPGQSHRICAPEARCGCTLGASSAFFFALSVLCTEAVGGISVWKTGWLDSRCSG